jgi:hypothetical protein
MSTVRIESTRKNLVVLPPVYNAPKDGDYKKRRRLHAAEAIQPADWDPIPNKLTPKVTFISKAYWDAVKDNPEVKRLFTDGQHGLLRVLDAGDVGPTADVSKPKELPSNDGEAMALINNCDDEEQLRDWARQASDRPNVLGLISGRFSILDAAVKRGTKAKADR